MKKQKITPFNHVRDAKQFTKFAHLNLVRNPGVPMYQAAASAANTAYLDARRAFLVQDETANIILDLTLAGELVWSENNNLTRTLRKPMKPCRTLSGTRRTSRATAPVKRLWRLR